MKIREKGPGDPEVAVVYCTHGDETAGKKAVERLLENGPDLKKGVKFVLANEKAYKAGERYIDTDLNRSFPGDPESESYEERIAAKMVEELKEFKVLDLHETSVDPTPFALFTWMDEEIFDLLASVETERAVEISYTPGCGINHYGGIEVETGPRGTRESVEEAYMILKQFLATYGVIEKSPETYSPKIFSVYESRKKPEGEWNVDVGNFEIVSEGSKVAEKVGSDEKIVAQESFYPVLFAESYDEIFGFKSVRLEKVEDRVFDK